MEQMRFVKHPLGFHVTIEVGTRREKNKKKLQQLTLFIIQYTHFFVHDQKVSTIIIFF